MALDSLEIKTISPISPVPPAEITETVGSREQQLQTLRDSLRPGQQPLAYWQGGEMAVSAVPGAGKSHSLSVAAAIAIARHQLHTRKQLVIVTYTRSAAASIKSKIRERLRELQLPQTGFSVQTLHGLALNIASRHQGLSGLNLETASVVIPTPSHRLIRTCVEQWLQANPERYRQLLQGAEFDGEETERLRRQSSLRTEVLPNLAYMAIHEAKSSGLSPAAIWQLSQQTTDNYEILALAAGLYEQYEQLMRSRDFIDYDDMILAALRVLEDSTILQHWQEQVFAVFEDEAQDSSPLQEKLISRLAMREGSLNLIRVGDPNQAINSTFTPADPVYFNWFCQRCQSDGRLAVMEEAGRSAPIIIEAANFLLQWVSQYWQNQRSKTHLRHQVASQNPLPFRVQAIHPVPSGDPQPNPEPQGHGLEIYLPEDIYQTVDLIGKRAVALLEANPEGNAAILVRENRQGHFLAEKLAQLTKEKGIRLYQVSEFDRFSRIPAEILQLLRFIDRPHSPDNLKAALEILQQRELIAAQDLNALVTLPEQFLYPGPLESPSKKPAIEKARRYCCQLLQARLELPHYQLIPFLGMALNYSGSELATVQKLAERLEQQIVGNSSLKTAIAALDEIVASERFEGVDEDAEDQYVRPNQLTIITMHKAKGLDWDYVFVPFLHEDVLPGRLRVPAAAKFLGDFSLAEVARVQIRAAVHGQYLQPDSCPTIPQPLEAWQEAASLKLAEEFRLLYVAVTRAKRLLWLSAARRGPFRWNTFNGHGGETLSDKVPCPALTALIAQFPDALVEFCPEVQKTGFLKKPVF